MIVWTIRWWATLTIIHRRLTRHWVEITTICIEKADNEELIIDNHVKYIKTFNRASCFVFFQILLKKFVYILVCKYWIASFYCVYLKHDEYSPFILFFFDILKTWMNRTPLSKTMRLFWQSLLLIFLLFVQFIEYTLYFVIIIQMIIFYTCNIYTL